jgi:hypothetical protein
MSQETFLDIPPPSEFRVPENAPYQTCRSCGAAIVWITTAKGKAMPLHTAQAKEYASGRYAPSHFAYCRDANAWRKPR